MIADPGPVYIKVPRHTNDSGVISMQSKEENQKLLQSLLGQLNEEDKKKLNSILADKTQVEKILNTPQAQEVMKKFKGGK